MRAYLLLTLRRERLAPAALALSFGLLLLIAALHGMARPSALGARNGLELAVWMGVFVGLPCSALLLGASAGAALRHCDEEDGPLPLSAGEKAAAAVAAPAVSLGALVGLVAAAGFAVERDWRHWAYWGPGGVWTIAAGLAAGLVLLLCAAFACSFLLRHAVAGALFAAALLAAHVETIQRPLALAASHPGRGSPVLALVGVVAAAVLSLTAALAVGVRLEGRLRPPGWPARWPYAALLLGGIAASAAMGASLRAGVISSEQFFLPSVGRVSIAKDERGRHHLRCDPTAAPDGVFLTALDGRLVHAAPDGTRTVLIPGAPEGVSKRSVEAVFSGRGGRLWALCHDGRQLQVWSGTLSGGLSLSASLAGDSQIDAVLDQPEGPALLAYDPMATSDEPKISPSGAPGWSLVRFWGRLESWDLLPDGSSAEWLQPPQMSDASISRAEGLVLGRGQWLDLERDGRLDTLAAEWEPLVEKDGRFGTPAHYDPAGRRLYLVSRGALHEIALEKPPRVTASWRLTGAIVSRSDTPAFQAARSGLFVRTRWGAYFLDWRGRRRAIRVE